MTLVIQTPVLQYQRNVRDAEFEIECFLQRQFFVVFDYEQACESEINLLAGEVMRVRMVPIGRCTVRHGKVVVVRRATRHGVMWATIVVAVHLQTMPVNDAGFLDAVPEFCADLAATAQAYDGIEQAFPLAFDFIGKQFGRLAGNNFLLHGFR